MTLQKWNRFAVSLASGLAACLMTTGLFAQSSAAVGFVRISDRAQTSNRQPIQQTALSRARYVDAQRGTLLNPAPVNYADGGHAMTGNPVVDLIRTASNSRQTASQSGCSCSSCQAAETATHGDTGCDSCGGAGCSSCSGSECETDSNFGRMVRDYSRAEMRSKRRCMRLFGEGGCGGQGCPPFGHYHLLYSANPRYFDARDGRVYAAQGYGVPMAVPLAPNVRHTYNYGWGIPSSRLTPISTRAPF